MRAIPVGTLIIAGGATSLVPQEHIEELARILPDGEVATVNAGHLIHASAPAEFLAHVTTFLSA